MHNSWQNFAKIEFHQDFLKGKNLERFTNSNLFAKLFFRSSTCSMRLRVVERTVKLLAAQKLSQILISTRDDNNRNESSTNYVYKRV